jgi:pimeloyl-ACP methyl ester carboxylesterase
MPVFEKGPVHIHYQEAGSGFPLLLIPGGGLNSTISYFSASAPFNALEELKGDYRCIAMDLICATPTAAGPPARWRSTGLGMRSAMIRSA